MNYFNKLPTISYQGQMAKNLLARAKLSDSTRNNKLVFQKYTTGEMDRPDMLSNDYYNSPGYSWLVFFSNNIIDPYYGMSLSEQDFQGYIIKRYGSTEKAARTISFYRVNWDALVDDLTPQQFETAGSIKKYYTPILDSYLQVVKYILKRDDTAVATNFILQLQLDNIAGTFIEGEEVRVSSNTYGFVAGLPANGLILKHITESTNTFQSGATVTGVDSGATATISQRIELSRSIPLNEVAFWQPVTILEAETELNEAKKEIKLLDARYRDNAEAELRRVMRDR